MLQKRTLALVVAGTLVWMVVSLLWMVVSLVVMGKTYSDKRAAELALGPSAQSSRPAWPPQGIAGASRGGNGPFAQGQQETSGPWAGPGGGETPQFQRNGPGGSGRRGQMPQQNGGQQRPNAAGGQPPSARSGPGGPVAPTQRAQTPVRPGVASQGAGFSGPGGAPAWSSSQRMQSPRQARPAAQGGQRPALPQGVAPIPAQDARLAGWLRDAGRARETIENAKVAVREYNQDQILELLNQALAQLSSLPTSPFANSPTGGAIGGAGAAPWMRTGVMPIGVGDALALGGQTQEALYGALEQARSLPPEQYQQQRAQLAMGLLTELLMAGPPRPPLPAGEAGRGARRPTTPPSTAPPR